jgi:hypothetical protein
MLHPLYLAAQPRLVPNPRTSAPANAFETSRPVVAIGTMEYCLGKDGDVLHRMAGNVTLP